MLTQWKLIWTGLTGVFGVADIPRECDTTESCNGEGELELAGKTAVDMDGVTGVFGVAYAPRECDTTKLWDGDSELGLAGKT